MHRLCLIFFAISPAHPAPLDEQQRRRRGQPELASADAECGVENEVGAAAARVVDDRSLPSGALHSPRHAGVLPHPNGLRELGPHHLPVAAVPHLRLLVRVHHPAFHLGLPRGLRNDRSSAGRCACFVLQHYFCGV